MEESKTIKKLKSQLIKELPFFPNTKETRDDLESQNLNDLLINYIHWKTRIIPPRVRKVKIAPEVTADKRWKDLRDDINNLLNKIRNGEDIYPYHSQRAHRYAYTPPKTIRNGESDHWEDKDQLLNITGYHHLHLSMKIQSTGLSERTNDVIFALASRNNFHAIGIFNHDVFESEDNGGTITKERERMLKIYRKHQSMMINKPLIENNQLTLRGLPVELIRMCDHYAQIIRKDDSKLFDRTFVNNLYDNKNLLHPNKYNLEWVIKDLDLGLYDKKNRVYFSLNECPVL